ncbi:MAG: hypothetical protein V1827_04475 [Candidatus Micrarchaeota archaeon]
MAEGNSSSRRTTIRAYGKPLSHPAMIARSQLLRLGIPIIESPLPQTHPRMAKKEDLENQFVFVFRSGAAGERTHPDLPGVEVSGISCRYLAQVAHTAQEMVLLPHLPLTGIRAAPPVVELFSDADFRQASRKKDDGAMMRIATERFLVTARIRQVSNGSGAECAAQAEADVKEALEISKRYDKAKELPPADKDSLPADIAQMSILSKKHPEMSDYEIALMAIEAGRRGEIEKEGSLMHVEGRVLKEEEPLDPRIRKLLPPMNGKDGGVDLLIMVRTLVRLAKAPSLIGQGIPPELSAAVQNLRMLYSPETVVQFAKTLVERRERPKRILASMTDHEADLLCKAMGAQSADGSAVGSFLDLSPAEREMRVGRAINGFWLTSGWRGGGTELRDARISLYAKCDIKEPSCEEWEKLSPDMLSEAQKGFVASLMGIAPGDVASDDIKAFGIWLRADQKEIDAYWRGKNPDHSAMEDLMEFMRDASSQKKDVDFSLLEKILGKPNSEFTLDDFSAWEKVEKALIPMRRSYNLWYCIPQEERMRFWRKGKVDLLSVAGLAHKLKFAPKKALTPDEDHVVSEVLVSAKGYSSLNESEREMFQQMLYGQAVRGEDGGKSFPRSIKELFSQGSMDARSLLEAAHQEGEFRILAGALGVGYPSARAKTIYNDWDSASHGSDDGAFSSVEVSFEEGRTLRLDLVADGMSQANLEGGYGAAAIARDVFEICAIAGWITGPEDARLALMIADMAIINKQMKRGNGLSLRADASCTAAIGVQDGGIFYGVHAGDCAWAILRGGEEAHSSQAHSGAWGHRRRLYETALNEARQIWLEASFDPYDLPDSVGPEFERDVRDHADRLFESDLKGGAVPTEVESALGGSLKEVHINNAERGYLPIMLQEGDIIVLYSGGLADAVRDRSQIAVDACQGSLKAAQQVILESAADGEKNGTYTIMMRHPSGKAKPGASKPKKKAARQEAHPEDSGEVMVQEDRIAEECFGSVPSLPDEVPDLTDELVAEPDGDAALPLADIGTASGSSTDALAPPGCAQPNAIEHATVSEDAPIAKGAEGPEAPAPGIHAAQAEDAAAPEAQAGFRPRRLFGAPQEEALYLDDMSRPLAEDATLFLDRAVRAKGNPVVQETAKELGVLPRDLEIMAIYAFTGLDLQRAKGFDPRHDEDDHMLIGLLSNGLEEGYAPEVLKASMELFYLTSPDACWSREQRQEMLANAGRHIKKIDPISMSFGYLASARRLAEKAPEQKPPKNPGKRRTRR